MKRHDTERAVAPSHLRGSDGASRAALFLRQTTLGRTSARTRPFHAERLQLLRAMAERALVVAFVRAIMCCCRVHRTRLATKDGGSCYSGLWEGPTDDQLAGLGDGFHAHGVRFNPACGAPTSPIRRSRDAAVDQPDDAQPAEATGPYAALHRSERHRERAIPEWWQAIPHGRLPEPGRGVSEPNWRAAACAVARAISTSVHPGRRCADPGRLSREHGRPLDSRGRGHRRSPALLEPRKISCSRPSRRSNIEARSPRRRQIKAQVWRPRARRGRHRILLSSDSALRERDGVHRRRDDAGRATRHERQVQDSHRCSIATIAGTVDRCTASKARSTPW